jgi:hypothetical protein
MWDEDDDEAQQSMRQCIDCRAVAPKTDTNYTLISSKYGWRLSRRTDSAGSLIVEWRCPTCWDKHKAQRAPASPASTGPAGSSPPSVRRPELAAPPSSRRPEPIPPSRRLDTPPPSRRFQSDSDDPPPGPPPSRRFR